jgi:plasmid replication initiation protein
VNRRVPVIEVSIEELRTVLSVSDGKLTRWVDLNRFAIEPALRQINDNPNASGFSVEVETVSKGRKIERVRFKVTKAAERIVDDAELKLRISHREASEAKSAERRPLTPPYQLDAALTIVRREASGLDAYAILAEFDRWLKTSKEPVKNTLGALTQFARTKRKEWGGPLFEGRKG